VKTPDRTSAAAFLRYAAGEVLADSSSLLWKGLFPLGGIVLLVWRAAFCAADKGHFAGENLVDAKARRRCELVAL